MIAEHRNNNDKLISVSNLEYLQNLVSIDLRNITLLNGKIISFESHLNLEKITLSYFHDFFDKVKLASIDSPITAIIKQYF